MPVAGAFFDCQAYVACKCPVWLPAGIARGGSSLVISLALLSEREPGA